jgi:hypothetical protein
VTRAKAVEILNRDYDGTILCRDILHNIPNPDCDILDGVDYLNDLLIALLTAIDALEQGNGWISVKDRMPEDGVEVLVYGDIYLNRKGADVDFVDKSGNFFYYDEGEVTHWRPLPEPPESAEIMEAIAGSETPDKAERRPRT